MKQLYFGSMNTIDTSDNRVMLNASKDRGGSHRETTTPSLKEI